MEKFQIQSSYKPSGDQPSAIEKICQGIEKDCKDIQAFYKTIKAKKTQNYHPDWII